MNMKTHNNTHGAQFYTPKSRDSERKRETARDSERQRETARNNERQVETARDSEKQRKTAVCAFVVWAFVVWAFVVWALLETADGREILQRSQRVLTGPTCLMHT